jgi:hypothetical protein
VSAAQYRIISAAGGDVEKGSADVAVGDGVFTLAPPGGSPLRVPFSHIRSVDEPQPYFVRVTLADGSAIELHSLGTMRTQLLAELRDGRAEVAAETAAAVGEAEIFRGTAGGDSAEVRVYDDALLIITAAATMRISFSFVGAVQVRDYTVTVEVAGHAPVLLTRLGRRSGELADLLTTRLREASGRTSAFLASLLPGLDPMTLRAASGLLRDGVAAPVSALDGLHPELSSALLGIATLPERQEMVTELARRTDLAIGFKQITSVRRPAVGVTPWYDHAVTPHIGDHGAPGGRFGPGLGGMLGAGIMSGIGSGGFGGGYGGGLGGWGDCWAFRALGAGMNGQQNRPMAPRADVNRGLLTPATEDLSALTLSGEDPTVLAFALGRRSDDGLPSLVLYEVLNQLEPLTYAYQPDTGSGTNELAAVNRCLDDAGFQADAVHAEGLTSTGGPDASPLARWLAAKVPHDNQWASRLSALLTAGRLGATGRRACRGGSGGGRTPRSSLPSGAGRLSGTWWVYPLAGAELGYRTSSPVIVRPISIRWISDVPSKIVKILAIGAVYAGRRPAAPRGISTHSARPVRDEFRFLAGPVRDWRAGRRRASVGGRGRPASWRTPSAGYSATGTNWLICARAGDWVLCRVGAGLTWLTFADKRVARRVDLLVLGFS